MKERGVADFSFPSFCDTRHNILCSELKQLYVAITRTRRRLWIYESVDEFSRPMVNYWRNLSLIEVKNVDNSVTDTLQSFSTPKEWKSRGMKVNSIFLIPLLQLNALSTSFHRPKVFAVLMQLFWEKNYEMALMCFKQAGETGWEKRAKADGLMATAEQLRSSDPNKARTCLLEAAQIFYSIDRFKSAADCFYDVKDYKQAGMTSVILQHCSPRVPDLVLFSFSTLQLCLDSKSF